ncbi:transmembrane channel-like protein 5 [Pelobates fuscus]|uniref:transmembrane channel-like protein 5 n=1 Tax=Pelobates fuscus TaxID=191477 RepID=UPI002FE4C064
MSLNYNDGIINTGYHDSDTMELDRGQYGRPSSRQKSTFNHNPYGPNDDDVGYQQEPTEWRGGRGFLSMNSVQPEFDYNREIPRYSDSRNNPYEGQINPVFQHEQEPSYFGQSYERPLHMDNDPSEGDTNVRRRSKKQSFLPMQTLNTATPDSSPEQHAGHNYTQENENLVGKLTEMSNDDIDKEIRKIQRSLNDKRVLRNQVIKIKQRSAKGSSGDCCSGCIYSVKKTFRKAKRFASDVSTAFKLWHSTLKVIEGKFGTSILSYFIFLRWLLAFNIFSFIINFSFITIPQFFDMSQNNLSFSGLELLTGAGYFEETILYYGFYTNSTIQKEANLAPYNMQLAYIFTIGLYLATCFLILLYSMGKSYRDHFINPSSFSGNAAKLLCSWDFSITNIKAVDLKKKHLSTQIKETLSEKLMEKLKLTLKEKIARFSIHVAAWIISTGIAVGCCAGVYELCTIVDGVQTNITVPLTKQASTLVVPVVVSLINLLVPLVYATLGLMETYKYPRHYIYAVIIRNVLLKISIIGILCYYWLNYVAKSDKECWESYVGQDIYRLVVIDFLFALMGSLFGELVRRIIGTHCCKKLGKPEFDIARNVLDLIYAQTLAWIGIFFSPLLPLIQMTKLFIIFYLKRVSLMVNCIPPRRAWRASQMTTIFIFLLFFPSFAGVLCVIGVTVWRTHPSKTCGPFQTLDTPYESITNWVATINFFVNAKWIVWIYNNIVTSVLFFYILTLIILIISYLYMQIVRGRKIMVKHLLEQIGNEGNDKVFLLKELRKTHNLHAAPVIVPYEKQSPPSQGVQEFHIANESKTSLQRSGSIGATDALALAMMARHEAELEGDTQAANERNLRASRGKSDAMAMIMRARQEAEAEATGQSGTSEALAMAMRARQQAEMDR